MSSPDSSDVERRQSGHQALARFLADDGRVGSDANRGRGGIRQDAVGTTPLIL